MPRRDAEVVVIVKKTLTLASGTGFTDAIALPEFGVKGRITMVIERLHTGGAATAARFYLADADLVGASPSAVPADEDIVYDSGSVSQTASATAASLNDNVEVDGGAPYDVTSDGKLIVFGNVTAGSGASSFRLSISARVQMSQATRTL